MTDLGTELKTETDLETYKSILFMQIVKRWQ